MSMAKSVVCGNVVSDPEKRYTANNTPVTSFTLFIPGGSNKNDTPFMVRVVCWRALADAAADLQKGTNVVVEGRLQVAQFETPGGVSKRMYEIDANNIYFGQVDSILQGVSTGRFEQPMPPTAGYTQAAPATGVQQSNPNGWSTISSSNLAAPASAMAGVASASSSVETPEDPGMFLTEDDIPF